VNRGGAETRRKTGLTAETQRKEKLKNRINHGDTEAQRKERKTNNPLRRCAFAVKNRINRGDAETRRKEKLKNKINHGDTEAQRTQRKN
jgi:hypothetical protein